jgi:hypothetical protein
VVSSLRPSYEQAAGLPSARRRLLAREKRPANRRNVPTHPGVGPQGTRPRDLRPSFITLQIYASVPLTTVAKQCGTSVPMIEKRYAGVIENWDGVQVPAEYRIHAARGCLTRSGRRTDPAVMTALTQIPCKASQSRRGDSNPGPLHYE